MSNTNNGVFFAVVDADSYRWIMADNPAGEELGPLHDLPTGIGFAEVAAWISNRAAIRCSFDRPRSS